MEYTDGTALEDFEGHSAAIVDVSSYAAGELTLPCRRQVGAFPAESADGARTAHSNDPAARLRALTGDQHRLAIVAMTKLIRIYRAANGQVPQTLSGHAAEQDRCRFTGRTSSSVAAGGEELMTLWDANTNRLLEKRR